MEKQDSARSYRPKIKFPISVFVSEKNLLKSKYSSKGQLHQLKIPWKTWIVIILKDYLLPDNSDTCKSYKKAERFLLRCSRSMERVYRCYFYGFWIHKKSHRVGGFVFLEVVSIIVGDKVNRSELASYRGIFNCIITRLHVTHKSDCQHMLLFLHLRLESKKVNSRKNWRENLMLNSKSMQLFCHKLCPNPPRTQINKVLNYLTQRSNKMVFLSCLWFFFRQGLFGKKNNAFTQLVGQEIYGKFSLTFIRNCNNYYCCYCDNVQEMNDGNWLTDRCCAGNEHDIQSRVLNHSVNTTTRRDL